MFKRAADTLKNYWDWWFQWVTAQMLPDSVMIQMIQSWSRPRKTHETMLSRSLGGPPQSIHSNHLIISPGPAPGGSNGTHPMQQFSQTSEAHLWWCHPKPGTEERQNTVVLCAPRPRPPSRQPCEFLRRIWALQFLVSRHFTQSLLFQVSMTYEKLIRQIGRNHGNLAHRATLW